MGKLNEIQEQMTQSYGDNAFTTTIKDDTVEFDSTKDSFTFNDEVNVPSLKVNGQEITPSEPQVQADWNQTTSAESDYIKNKPTIKSGQGEGSIVEGNSSTANGPGSHAEGQGTVASGYTSHAEGNGSTASGGGSHAEGGGTTASGDSSHAEGASTNAIGPNSHAEGASTNAIGGWSHAEGYQTTANNKCQHVFGSCNIADPSLNDPYTRGNYVEIVGNGVKTSAKSNARTLDWSGNENIAGMLRIGSSASTGGCLFKVDGTSLKISFDNGTTWLAVSAS